MSLIDSSTKFVGINPNFPTAERKSAQNNAAQEVVTMQDITDTVLSVSPIPPDPAPLAFANAATVGVLSFSPNYDNGSSGVGATLTATLPGVLRDTSAVGKIDSTYTPVVGNVILVKNQASALQNGLYVITNAGSLSTTYVLTRVVDFDQSAELYPLQINVISGASNALKYFIQTTANPTVGVSNLVFTISSFSTVYQSIAFVDTVIDTPLNNIVYANGTSQPTVPGSGATLTSTQTGALGTYYGLTANTNDSIANSFTRVLLINQTNAAYNGDYQVINAGSLTTNWKLIRINNTAKGFNRYNRYFVVSNPGSTKTGKVYFTKPNDIPLTNGAIGTASINIFEYGGSGLSVGTTPITSGTAGRLLFQGSGDVLQQDSSLFWDNTNKRLGIGATPDVSTRLDVRAQGVISTDIAFRIRNSANLANIFSASGSSQFIFGTSTSSAEGALLVRHDYGSAQPILTLRNGQYDNLIFQVRDERTADSSSIGSFRMNGIISGGTSGTTKQLDLGGHGLGASYGDSPSNPVWLNNQGNIGDGVGSTVISVSSNFYINKQTTKVFKFNPVLGNFGISQMTFGTNATNTMAIASGVAPTTSPVDAIQFYSKDIVAGNAAPHFRTESGDVIRLYKQTLPAIPTLTDITNLLTNLGLI